MNLPSKWHQEFSLWAKCMIFLHSKGHLVSLLFSWNLLKHPYSICQTRQDYSRGLSFGSDNRISVPWWLTTGYPGSVISELNLWCCRLHQAKQSQDLFSPCEVSSLNGSREGPIVFGVHKTGVAGNYGLHVQHSRLLGVSSTFHSSWLHYLCQTSVTTHPQVRNIFITY